MYLITYQEILLFVLLLHFQLFINKPESSIDLEIFVISFVSSFPFIDVFVPDPNIFLWIAASLADAVNTNGIKALVANGLSVFPITDNAVFSTGSSTKGLFKNLPDCPIDAIDFLILLY